jgi:hypothetical protein
MEKLDERSISAIAREWVRVNHAALAELKRLMGKMPLPQSVVPRGPAPRLRGDRRGIYGMSGRPNLLRLDVSRSDHLSPFLGFLREVFSEIRRRTGKYHGTKLREPRLEFSIGEARIDLDVELIDDLGGRALGGADAIPRTRVVTGDEIGDNRNVGQRQGAW